MATGASITGVQLKDLVGQYSYAALQAALEEIQTLMAKKKQATDDFGSLFNEIVGQETILKIEEVSAKELGLDNVGKYPTNVVETKQLNGRAVVRGVDGHNRPFIAMRVELLDLNGQKVSEVVEVVFKRYSIDGDGKKGAMCENNWVTALYNKDENGFSFKSALYSSGGMSKAQIQLVKDLLDGKTVKTIFSDGICSQKLGETYIRAHYLRLAQPTNGA